MNSPESREIYPAETPKTKNRKRKPYINEMCTGFRNKMMSPTQFYCNFIVFSCHCRSWPHTLSLFISLSPSNAQANTHTHRINTSSNWYSANTFCEVSLYTKCLFCLRVYVCVFVFIQFGCKKWFFSLSFCFFAKRSKDKYESEKNGDLCL